MHLEFEYTFKEFREAGKASGGATRSSKPRSRWSGVTGWVLWIGLAAVTVVLINLPQKSARGVQYVSDADGWERAARVAIPLAPWALIVGFIVQQSRRGMKKRWEENAPLKWRRKLDVSERGLVWTLPQARVETSWFSYGRFVETRRLFLLYHGASTSDSEIVPKRAFTEVGAIEGFRDLLREKIENRTRAFPVVSAGAGAAVPAVPAVPVVAVEEEAAEEGEVLFRLDYQYTHADMEEFSMANLRGDWLKALRWRFAWKTGLLMALAGCSLGLNVALDGMGLKGRRMSNGFGVALSVVDIVVLVLGGYVLVKVVSRPKKTDYRRMFEVNFALQEPVSARVDEAGLTVRNAHGLTQWHWGYFHGMVQTPNLFLLKMPVENQYYMIPKRALVDEAGVERFGDFLRGKIACGAEGVDVQKTDKRKTTTV